MCTPSSESQALAGEDCRITSSGIYFINTNDASPYATGRVQDMVTTAKTHQIFFNPISHIDQFQKEIDPFGKLEGNFNNLPFSSSKGDDFSPFFVNHGSNELSQSFVNTLRYSAGHDEFDFERRKINYGKIRWPDSKSNRHPRTNELSPFE